MLRITCKEIRLLVNYDRTAKQQQNYANQYHHRMIQQGLITPAGSGQVRFKLPLFKEYLDDTRDINPARYDPLL